jgi:hypothetical protein
MWSKELYASFELRLSSAASLAAKGDIRMGENHSRVIRESWKNPEQRARRLKSMKAANRRPEVIEKRRKAALNRPPASKSLCEIRSRKAKERWARPEFKEKMIKICLRVHNKPSVKNKHRLAVRGKQFGKRVSVFVKTLAKILLPLGYIKELPIPNNYKHARGGYCVDFGLPERKIAIECDGPRHRTPRYKRTGRDEKKNKILRALGWRVIRVPHD